MKLRLRSLETKQTHKIEVPNSCNLQQLNQFICPLSSSSAVQQKLLFSLNRKDELYGEESLQSLGVASGDLIYYTLNPYAFASPNPNLLHVKIEKPVEIEHRNDKDGNLMNTQVLDCGKSGELSVFRGENRDYRGAQMEKLVETEVRDDKGGILMNTQVLERGENVELGVSRGESGDFRGAQMEKLMVTEVRNDKDSNLMNIQVLECGKSGELNVFRGEGGDLEGAQTDGLSKLGEFAGSSDQSRGLVGARMEELAESCNRSDHAGELGSTQLMECGKLDEGDGPNAESREMGDIQMGGSLELSDANDRKSVDGGDEMEVDDEYVDDVSGRFSVPSFLKKVFVKEVGDAGANGGNHKLLVIAVHAVLLESGFVGYDPVSGLKVDGFHLPDEWPSSAFGISLHYTLPEVSTSEVVETVVLKFQALGKFVNIYGSLSKKGFGVHRVCLDEPRFVPALSYVWKMNDYTDPGKESDGSMNLYPNQEIFEFWKIVKDGLSYPLLINLCEKVGLVPPPCFMQLPTELKLKIMESLPAVDVARVECVCTELRFVASNNDLWKMKYEDEFGNAADSRSECQWKAKFCSTWEIRKKRKRMSVPLQWPHFRPLFPGRRDPNPFGLPFIIGGDYDRLPGFGIPQNPGRRIFRTNCDLGGFGM